MPLPPRCRGGERRRYREAVLGGPAPPGAAADPATRRPPRVLAGSVIDASPHLLVLREATGATGATGAAGTTGSGGEIRLPLTSSTSVWYGGRGGLAALRPGREVIVRCAPDGLGADRIWVDIGRVTGTILACGRDTVDVDMGPHRGCTQVVIPPRARGRVLVRHPRLEPGYLIDVICVRSAWGPQAVKPGTSQPGHRAADLAEPEPEAPVPETLRGTATWFGGAAYEAPGSLARTTSAPSCPGEGERHPGGTAEVNPYATGGVPHPGLRTGPSPDAEGLPRNDGTALTPPGIPAGSGAPFRPASSDSGGSGAGAVPRHAGSRRKHGRTPPARHGRSVRAARRRPGPGVPETPRPDVRAAGPEFRLAGSLGVAYPALDPEGQGGGCPTAPPPGCAPLPYLSLGSQVVVRNECSGLAAALPVIECGCVAAGYCDRCVECDTSPRGRLVELTPAAFVGLGGDLDAGCFNTVLRHDAPGAGVGG